MDTRRLLLVAAVAATVLLAGCAGLGDADDASGPAVETEGPSGDDAADAADAETNDVTGFTDGEVYLSASVDGETNARAALAAEQRLIRTGELALTVDDYGSADGEVRDVVTAYDGFVSEATRETRERDDEEYTVGELVVRVPSDDFDAAMDDLEALGEVEQVSTESRDVGEEVADLEARLENREAERDRLRDLYEDANTTEDVLAVQSELADTQEEIERLEARLASLEERVALATIRIQLAEEPPEVDPDEPEAWYDTGVSAAFLESVSGVGTALRAAVVAAAYAAPYVIAAVVPLGVVGFVIARRVDRSSLG